MLLQLSSCLGTQFCVIIVMLISQLVYLYLVHHFTWTWWHGNNNWFMGICKSLNMQILMICLLLQVASNLLDKEGRQQPLEWRANVSKDHNVHHQYVLQNYFTKFLVHKDRLFCCWYCMWWPLFLQIMKGVHMHDAYHVQKISHMVLRDVNPFLNAWTFCTYLRTIKLPMHVMNIAKKENTHIWMLC